MHKSASKGRKLLGACKGVVDILAMQGLVPAPLNDALEGCPAKKANSAEDKPPYYEIVLVAVALKAQGENVFILGILAKFDALTEAKGFRTLGTGR